MYLLENANLTGLTEYLNRAFGKKGGGVFTRRDVLGYIERKQLPTYLGGMKIEEINQKNCSVRLYNILK